MELDALDKEYRKVLEELQHCASALGPYRDDAVVIGGLVPLLYRFHEDYTVPRQLPILTTDLDLVLPENLPVRDESLVSFLTKGGFVIVPSRNTVVDAPPKHFFQSQHYGSEVLAPIHGEFLIPLTGSATDRNRKPKSPRWIQEGLSVEALRFLDLLRWKPIQFDIGKLMGGASNTIQIANPAAYCIQKALSSSRRSNVEKRDKDFAYLFDIATLTQEGWPYLRTEIQDLGRTWSTWKNWTVDAQSILSTAFATESSPGPLAVGKLYEGKITPKTAHRVMEMFLKAVGGQAVGG